MEESIGESGGPATGGAPERTERQPRTYASASESMPPPFSTAAIPLSSSHSIGKATGSNLRTKTAVLILLIDKLTSSISR